MTVIEQHVKGERIEAKHACPDCPTPLAALYVPPSPTCRTCNGTGLLTGEDLARWQYQKFLEEQQGC